jgi:predicted nucleic acid-binding protein
LKKVVTAIVVDASRIGNAVLPDEFGVITNLLLQTLAESQLVEPMHWPIEIANLVAKAARQNRLDREERAEARDAIASFIRGAEVETVSHALTAFDLSIHYHISVYDAGYLDLAIRRGLPLLTSDGGLRGAAQRAGVKLVELP